MLRHAVAFSVPCSAQAASRLSSVPAHTRVAALMHSARKEQPRTTGNGRPPPSPRCRVVCGLLAGQGDGQAGADRAHQGAASGGGACWVNGASPPLPLAACLAACPALGTRAHFQLHALRECPTSPFPGASRAVLAGARAAAFFVCRYLLHVCLRAASHNPSGCTIA